jgi:multidrug transporter EmrE-like cation transporter
MMPATTMSLILVAVACSTSGQLLLKAGAQRVSGAARLEFLLSAATDVRVLAGLALWGASAVCWLYVLRVTPLSRAYPLYSLTYVLTPLASLWVFDERVHGVQLAGMALIVLGIIGVLSAG